MLYWSGSPFFSMKPFKDNTDRSWDVVVNVVVIKRVRDICGVDLTKLYGDEAGRVFGDPCLLVDVLYAVCKEQADKSQVTDEQFGAAMVGDAIDHGANALMESVADFFPSSRRQILHKIKAKGEQVTEKMMQQADRMLDQAAAEMMAKLTSSDSATNSPA